jgi:hypothetical protein
MNTTIPFLDVRLQDIRHLSKLQIVIFESCRLLQPSQDFSEILTNDEAEAAATATESTTKTDIPTKTIIPERNTTAAVPSVSTESNNNSQRQRQNFPILRRLEFIRCLGFFRNEPMNSTTNEGDDGNDSSSSSLLSSSRAMEGKQTACDFCESYLDLSELRVFRLAQCNSELGNEEVSILCKKILSKCSQLEILDLSDGNIETVTATTTSGGGNSSSSNSSNNHHHSIDLLSCPLQKLRILDFSRNSMVCPERDDDDKETEEGGNSNGIIIDKTTMMISNRTRNNINIQSLCSLVETFPLLGHTGKFNILFLGKLGERHTRLHDYYRLVHHLCLNRARTRITMGQNVPIGLWPIALQKSQRAFDDYQGYELWGQNRKEEPDSIFNLLRERGAIDIFTSQKSRSERSI